MVEAIGHPAVSQKIFDMSFTFSGAGGNWPVIEEKNAPDVVRQRTRLSCGSACGEMLLKSRGIDNIRQEAIEDLAEAPTWPELLAEALNRLSPNSPGRWFGNFVDVSSFELLNVTGSWIAVLWEPGDRIGHMVVVDGTAIDRVFIRDPERGTRYQMLIADFLDYWNGQAVYWIGS